MKVWIGKYNTTWLISRLSDLAWNGSLKEQKLSYKILDSLDTIIQAILNVTFNKILVKRPARNIYIKVDSSDVINVDETLSHIIHPVLLKYKELNSSMFQVSDEDVPVSLQNNNQYCIHKVNFVLDEMIWTFSFIKDGIGDDLAFDDPKFNRVENGLKLFAKYFRSLWI